MVQVGGIADVALLGGRVIDPESGYDEVGCVAVSGDRIASVGPPVAARVELDCAGLVVSPGFVDLHSHAQTLTGGRLQALDGVTTAVDLEAGALAVRRRYARMQRRGRAINFGYSAGWAAAHGLVVAGADPVDDHDEAGFATVQRLTAVPGWDRPAGPTEVAEIVTVLERELRDGALGVGALLGYLPDSDPAEFAAVAGLAARHGAGTFVHSRSAMPTGPVTALDAVRELVSTAEATGGHLHLCHLNSTSADAMPAIVALLTDAERRGIDVTTEAYPYARGSTVVGASFLSPAELRREGRPPSSLIVAGTGRPIRDEAELDRLRAESPGALVLTLSFDTDVPREREDFELALRHPGAAFASDALPLGGPDTWPPAEGAFVHPRSAGCFARVLAELVRERGLISLAEALRRCTVLPADILARSAPAMARKGRLRVGMDADVVAFDPHTVADRATYRALAPSTGFRHVLVNGRPVVRDGGLRPDVLPGRPVWGRGHRIEEGDR